MRFFKTLSVEDNPLFRQTIMEILGHQFPSMVLEGAADGKTALEKIEDSLPDLIFMDIRLAGENGLHLTEQYQEEASSNHRSHPDQLRLAGIPGSSL